MFTVCDWFGEETRNSCRIILVEEASVEDMISSAMPLFTSWPRLAIGVTPTRIPLYEGIHPTVLPVMTPALPGQYALRGVVKSVAVGMPHPLGHIPWVLAAELLLVTVLPIAADHW